jgi:diguanylate cyclase (GGDEF)-like protein
MSSFLPIGSTALGLTARMARPIHVLNLFLFSVRTTLLMQRVEDVFIGLSCIAIAAALASFLSTAGQKIPFRWTLIALTVCAMIAGLCCLLSAAIVDGMYTALVGQALLFAAVLALLTAFLLPFLLPMLLSKSRELEFALQTAKRNEIRFLAATQSTDDAFILLEALRSPDGVIEDFLFTYINSNAEKLLLKRSSDVVGARLTLTLPIDPAGRLFQQYRQVVHTGQPLVHEFALEPYDPYSPWMRHQVTKLEDGLAITASDITDRKRTELDLLHLSQHDTLTGLPNYRLLDDRIQQAIARADRYSTRVAVFHINLDAFEHLNDVHGRAIGDQVLRVTAGRLRGAIRATDSVLRLDADEFIVLMPDMMLEIDIRHAAATLVAILREPMQLNGKRVECSCSLGASVYPEMAHTVEDLLTRAEVAMYRAKAFGKNQYVLYTPATDFGYDPDNDADVNSNPEGDDRAPVQRDSDGKLSRRSNEPVDLVGDSSENFYSKSDYDDMSRDQQYAD